MTICGGSLYAGTWMDDLRQRRVCGRDAERPASRNRPVRFGPLVRFGDQHGDHDEHAEHQRPADEHAAQRDVLLRVVVDDPHRCRGHGVDDDREQAAAARVERATVHEKQSDQHRCEHDRDRGERCHCGMRTIGSTNANFGSRSTSYTPQYAPTAPS